MDNYLMGRNSDTNTFDFNLMSKGQYRIMNDTGPVFEIDYLGNTVFTNDIVTKNSACFKFTASNKICGNTTQNTMDFSSPQGIRFVDDMLIQKGVYIGQDRSVGISLTGSNYSFFAGSNNNIKFGLGNTDKLVLSSKGMAVTGDTNIHGNAAITNSITANNAMFKDNVAAKSVTVNGVQIAAPNGYLAITGKLAATDIDVNNSLTTQKGINVNPSLYGPLIEANVNNDANRFGIGHYENARTRVYASGSDQMSTVNLGFAKGSDTWDDKVVIKNNGDGIIFNGDVTVNGKIKFGQYTFEADRTDTSALNVYLNGRLVKNFKFT